jgi:uridine kinase
MKTLVIGISGGSGSGKTTFARLLNQRLCDQFGERYSAILAQDHYYIDQSAKFRGDGDPAVNFDHPSAIDFPLIAEHLKNLKIGTAVEVPIYDFATHTRGEHTDPFAACTIVIVDGMLLLSQEVILPHLDYRIFVDAPETIRYARRLSRDVKERGRTPEGVEKQFKAQVKPMHDAYIEPSQKKANQIVSGTEPFEPVISALIETFITNTLKP